MPKRKRDDVWNVQTNDSYIPGRIPRRKSARLEERLQKEAAPEPDLPELYKLLPSPPTISHTKRESTASGSTKKLRESSLPDDRPIETWICTGSWPEKGIGSSMSQLSNSNKRPRSSSSFTQSCKDGSVPKQYTKGYEGWLLQFGLDMDIRRGKDRVLKESVTTCNSLQKVSLKHRMFLSIPEGAINKVLDGCQNRKEGIVNRDITPLLIPPLYSLFLNGEKYLEHYIDEVTNDWTQCSVLAGPQPRPDLALGLSKTAFTVQELEKLALYKAPENSTRFTEDMYFPFFMCEAKCGDQSLDYADRQNMHSCSIAVKAILRIEQEADKTRSQAKLNSLSGKILVFSLSHDQKDVRLYGYYAVINKDKWTYHRYVIKAFNILTNSKDLFYVYNFVRNTLKIHVPKLEKSLKDAIAQLPTVVSFVNDDSSQPDSQNADAVFKKPERPASAVQNEEMSRQITQLLQQMERQRIQHKEELEQQKKEHKEEVAQQKKEHKEEVEQQKKQHKELVELLKR